MQREKTPSLSSTAAEACPGCGQPADSTRCTHCGVAQTAGGFRVLRVLHQGPHGRMYLAEDEAGRKVALKELIFTLAPNAQQVDAFEREATLLQQVQHPRVPRFIKSFREGQGVELRLYLAQAYVAGESLLKRLEEHRFNEAEAMDIARQVLEILVVLHGRTPRILHRDIKPANLLRRPDGQLTLVDFGAARGLEQGATHRNTLVGTFGYMPPEQLGGTVDETSDLYALGATLLHLLSRKPPEALLNPRMELAFEEHVQVSEPFAAFLRKLVALPREERFSSAAEARRALGALKPGKPVSAPVRVPKRALGVAALGALLLGGYLVVWPRVEANMLQSERAQRRARLPVPTAVAQPVPEQPEEEQPGIPRREDTSGCLTAVQCAPLCEQGRASACGKLGNMYEAGIGVEPDAAKAVSLYERACELGEQRDCGTLAYVLDRGEMVPKDPQRAFRLAEQACEANEPDACEVLANMFESGREGIPRSMARAAQSQHKACDLGDLYACVNAGRIYRDGGGDLKKDLETAERLMRMACDKGVSYGCEKLEKLKSGEY